jgi:hypothetical protein
MLTAFFLRIARFTDALAPHRLDRVLAGQTASVHSE